MSLHWALLRVWLFLLSGLSWPALAQSPDYDALSDRYGNVLTEGHQAALVAMAKIPEQLEAVYRDAAAGNARAGTVWGEMELQAARAGAGVADRTTSPGCLVMAYRELSKECVPDWSFVAFLAEDKPGGSRLRELIFRAFATRARQRGLRNQVILSAVNGLIGIGVATAILREAEVAANAVKVQPSNIPSIAREIPARPIWSATGGKTAAENVLGHWRKHAAEFTEYHTAEEYAAGARRFLNEPPKGALTKVRPNREVVVYDPATNTFGVRAADGAPQTMFKPDPAKHHYPTNLDYFNAQ